MGNGKSCANPGCLSGPPHELPEAIFPGKVLRLVEVNPVLNEDIQLYEAGFMTPPHDRTLRIEDQVEFISWNEETHSERETGVVPNKTKSIIKIQSMFRGNKTRGDLESSGMLWSQKKPAPEFSEIPTGPPYVNNLESEHAPADGTIVFVDEFPEPSETVAEQIHKMGQFEYKKEFVDFKDLPYIGPVELEGQGVYFGQFKYGYKHGKGKQMFLNGSIYEGTWKNDMANGYGRLIHESGDVYIGKWQNDRAHGTGKYIHPDGSMYNGPWFQDNMLGLGFEEWQTDEGVNRYEGSYVYGKKHGNGRFFWADGSAYQGHWKDDNIEGDGVFIFPDGRKYTGTWKESKMHGHGIFVWPDGRFYEGGYVDDKKQGYGVFEIPKKMRYAGNWYHGEQNGSATITVWENGVVMYSKEGMWERGKWVKWYNNEIPVKV